MFNDHQHSTVIVVEKIATQLCWTAVKSLWCTGSSLLVYCTLENYTGSTKSYKCQIEGKWYILQNMAWRYKLPDKGKQSWFMQKISLWQYLRACHLRKQACSRHVFQWGGGGCDKVRVGIRLEEAAEAPTHPPTHLPVSSLPVVRGRWLKGHTSHWAALPPK